MKYSTPSTVLGMIALLLWSTTIAFTRGLAEQLGILTATAYAMLLGGAVGLLFLAFVQRKLGQVLRLSRRYLLGGLLLFIVYMVAFFLAIGLARDRETVVEAGLINYLWPGLTLVFAVPLQRKRATGWLLPGVVIAFAGVALASLPADYTLAGLGEKLQANGVVYLLALAAAVSWALYSNLSRVWGAKADAGAASLFLLVSGLVMLALSRIFPEQQHWSAGTVKLLLFVALGPTLLSYVFWDYGMRKGHLVLLASLSFFTPLFSTLISCLFLGVKAGLALWLACALVIAGAAICHASVKDRIAPAGAPEHAPH
jgi:drug/metabolite transporter (DMT)-like permease